MIVGLMLMMEDDVQGMLMFLLEQEFADVTLSALMGEGYGSVAEMDEMCQSAIQEIGNIMAEQLPHCPNRYSRFHAAHQFEFHSIHPKHE